MTPTTPGTSWCWSTSAKTRAVPAPERDYGFPGSLCVSVNDEAVHGVPGPRRIESGDLPERVRYAWDAVDQPTGEPESIDLDAYLREIEGKLVVHLLELPVLDLQFLSLMLRLFALCNVLHEPDSIDNITFLIKDNNA